MANQDVRSPSQSGERSYSVVRTALTVLLFAAAVFVVQRLTFTLRFPPFQRPTIWTPGALTLTALLLAPPRRWRVYYAGLCLGVFAAFSGDTAISVPTAMLAAQFHFGGVAVGSWVIRRFGTNPPFGNLPSFLVFSVIAVVLVPVMTTAPIDLVRFVGKADDVWPVALRSLLAGALGLLIATPALTLTVTNGRTWLRAESGRNYLEVAALAVGLLVAGYFCFAEPTGATASPALLYAPLPLLLWAAARFELAGVCWALLALAFQSTWAALQGRGPFTNQSPADNILQLQLFLLAISLPLMFLAIVIQERRRAFSGLSESEQEARRQFAQLAAIYHDAPIGLAFVDTQLRYISINDYLAEINGQPAAAHLGRTVRQVLPHLADTIEPLYRRVIETGQPVVDVEIRGLTASQPGIERSWLVSRHPVKNPMGAILGVITVVQETTERKQTDERFRLVVESTPNAIVMANGEGHIVLVNSQCETLFGYRREELVGQLVEVLVPERYRGQHPAYRTSFFASPSTRPMGMGHELYGRRKDGSEIPVEIGLTPIQTGTGLLVLSAIVDITERKRAEDARRELAHVSRLAIVGELTASIAHEINQPLGAILSNADAAEMLLDSGSASLDEVRQILDDIRKDDLRASEVIRRLRSLLRKRELEMEPLDLNEVTWEVLAMVRADALRRGVLVQTDLAVNLPAVRGDKVHLQQVLLNLVLNGMEAMADMPGVKRLAVRSVLNENGCVETAVSDAGTGIPPDRLPRLFDAFFSTKKEGMGLGLSIARSLVDAHGGRIWAENNPSRGATFHFTVPVEAQKPSDDPSDTPNASMELKS